MYVSCFMVIPMLIAQAASQDVLRTDGEPSSRRYGLDSFVEDQRVLSGDGWTVTKYKDEGDCCWRAKIESDGKVVKDIGGAGDSERWLRFLLWPPSGDAHRLLLVWRFAGGAHGPRMMDIIDLQDEFRTVFSSGNTLNCDDGIEDLDGDGWPEVLATSNRFDYFDFPIQMSHVESTFPPITLSYDPGQRRYINANLRFPERIQRAAEQSKSRFLHAWDEGGKIPVEVVLQPQDHQVPLIYLVGWVVQTCYEKGEETAFELLQAHADPVLALFAERAIQRTLRKDRWYEQLKQAVRRQDTEDRE